MLNLITHIEWFMVSERMPDYGSRVMFAIAPTRAGDPEMLRVGCCRDGKWYEDDDYCLSPRWHIVAWAHLPMTPAEILATPPVNPLLPSVPNPSLSAFERDVLCRLRKL